VRAGYKFPCSNAQRGGLDCRWDGTSGANEGAGGALVPAMPTDFYDWMLMHTGTLHSDMLRCGWSFRGVFAASAASIRKHRPGFYANLEEQLGAAVFPVAGMYMERMWRRVLLCAPAVERGSGSARVMAAHGGNASAAEYTQRRGGKPLGRGAEETRRRTR
jgi:hypothetical protein